MNTGEAGQGSGATSGVAENNSTKTNSHIRIYVTLWLGK